MEGGHMYSKKFCPECKKKGLKSKVYIGSMTSTLMAGSQYYDEEGNYHYNDPNHTTTYYSCSNGHKWSEID